MKEWWTAMNKSQLEFGYTLKMLREEKGLTQEQLAEKLGITPNAVGQFERGKIFPNYETTSNIINVLDIDANLLYSRDVVDYPDEAKWIARFMVNLSIDERKSFGIFLKYMADILIRSGV